MTAECEVCLESLERHRRALRAALEGAPRVLCVDFSGTRLFGSDGVRLVCEAAVCCDYLDVELRVLESAAVRRTLDVVASQATKSGLRTPTSRPRIGPRA